MKHVAGEIAGKTENGTITVVAEDLYRSMDLNALSSHYADVCDREYDKCLTGLGSFPSRNRIGVILAFRFNRFKGLVVIKGGAIRIDAMRSGGRVFD